MADLQGDVPLGVCRNEGDRVVEDEQSFHGLFDGAYLKAVRGNLGQVFLEPGSVPGRVLVDVSQTGPLLDHGQGAGQRLRHLIEGSGAAWLHRQHFPRCFRRRGANGCSDLWLSLDDGDGEVGVLAGDGCQGSQ